jgi:hypothetical protein
VAAPVKRQEKLFNVRDYGAQGDDEENDYAAISKALAAAQAAVSDTARPVVYFPPGKWRTDTTLLVPSGVTLRGASRDLSIIEGFGVLPPDRHTTAPVHPAPQTTLESLTFQRFTVKGPGAYWMAMINPPPPKGYDPRAEAVVNFTLRNCRLLAGDRQSSDTPFAYLQALAVPRFHNVQILDNDIVGSVNLGDFFLPSFHHHEGSLFQGVEHAIHVARVGQVHELGFGVEAFEGGILLVAVDGDEGDVLVFEVLDQVDGEEALPTPPLPLRMRLSRLVMG